MHREEYLSKAVNDAKEYLCKNFSVEFNRIKPETKINFPEVIVGSSQNFDTQTFTHDKILIELQIPKKIFVSYPVVNGITYKPFFENPEFNLEFVSDHDYVIDLDNKMFRKNSYFISLVHELAEILFYKKFYNILSSEVINSSKENLAHGYALFFEMLTIDFMLNKSRELCEDDEKDFKNYSIKRRSALKNRTVENEHYILFNTIYQLSEKNIYRFQKSVEAHLPDLIPILRDHNLKDENSNGNLEKRIKNIIGKKSKEF